LGWHFSTIGGVRNTKTASRQSDEGYIVTSHEADAGGGFRHGLTDSFLTLELLLLCVTLRWLGSYTFLCFRDVVDVGCEQCFGACLQATFVAQ
jgi:hypothetical protein